MSESRAQVGSNAANVNEKPAPRLAAQRFRPYVMTMPRKPAPPKLPGPKFPGRAFSVDDHRLHLVHAPEDRLAAVMTLIEGAKSSIRMFIYMFADDQTGTEVRDALIAAAERGVAVQLIIDSFGSADIKDQFFDPLKDAGGRYHCFSSRWGWGYLVRNHQKILIVDEQHALVGGYNITDNYVGRKGDDSWEDLGVILSGPQVGNLARYYDNLADLSEGGKIAYRKMRALIRSWRPKNEAIQFLLSGPTTRLSPLGLSYKRAMEQAKRVDLAMAYFSPSQTVLRRIGKVTRHGQSRLVMAGKTDNGATISAARLLYRYLLKRGAKIYEYQTLPLHMKLMIIDDAVYIGSANLDVRSLFINMEIMLKVDDAKFAAHCRKLIGGMVEQSEEYTLALLKQRGNIFARIRSALAYFLVNTVDYSIGRRITFGLISGR